MMSYANYLFCDHFLLAFTQLYVTQVDDNVSEVYVIRNQHIKYLQSQDRSNVFMLPRNLEIL